MSRQFNTPTKQILLCVTVSWMMLCCASKPKADDKDGKVAITGTDASKKSVVNSAEKKQPQLLKTENISDAHVDLAFQLNNVDHPEHYTLFVLSSAEAMTENNLAGIDWSAAKQGESGMTVTLNRDEEEQYYFVYANVQQKGSSAAVLTEQYKIKVPALESVVLNSETFAVLSGTEILCAYSQDTTTAIVVYDQDHAGIRIHLSKDDLKNWQVSNLFLAEKDVFTGISGNHMIVIARQSLQSEKSMSNQYLAMKMEDQVDPAELSTHPLINDQEQFNSVADQQKLQHVVFSGEHTFLSMSCAKENKIVRMTDLTLPTAESSKIEILELENVPQIKIAYPMDVGQTAQAFIYVNKDNDVYWGEKKQLIQWDQEHTHMINIYLPDQEDPNIVLYDSDNKRLVMYRGFLEESSEPDQGDTTNNVIVWKPYKQHHFAQAANIENILSISHQNNAFMLVESNAVRMIDFTTMPNQTELNLVKQTMIGFKKPVAENAQDDEEDEALDRSER